MDLSKYTPDVVAKLRDDYVGNETDTDQYRETQPGAGFRLIGALYDLVDTGKLGMDQSELLELAQTWVNALGGDAYAGAEQAEPLYLAFFEALWQSGEHPYFSDLEEIDEWLADTAEADHA